MVLDNFYSLDDKSHFDISGGKSSNPPNDRLEPQRHGDVFAQDRRRDGSNKSTLARPKRIALSESLNNTSQSII